MTLNDDLIVSKRSAECPEDDEDDCTYDVEANKKDNLIYPMTVITTRKPRQYVWRILFALSFGLSCCHKYDTTTLMTTTKLPILVCAEKLEN